MSAASSAMAHFPNEAGSAAAARRFLTATLDGWDLGDMEEVATLLVSELVSNALLHAGTDLDVQMHRLDGRLRVEVHDRSPRLPERKYYSTASVTGRGLVFVAELSESWGAEPTDDGGKAVWFELDEGAVPPPAPVARGAEFRLEDWDDMEGWDDLPPQRADEDRAGGLPGSGTTSSHDVRWPVGV